MDPQLHSDVVKCWLALHQFGIIFARAEKKKNTIKTLVDYDLFENSKMTYRAVM